MARPDRKSWQEALLEVQHEIEGGERSLTFPAVHPRAEIIETTGSPELIPPAPGQGSPAASGDEIIPPPPPSRIREATSASGRWLVIGTVSILMAWIAFFLAAYRRIAVVTTYN